MIDAMHCNVHPFPFPFLFFISHHVYLFSTSKFSLYIFLSPILFVFVGIFLSNWAGNIRFHVLFGIFPFLQELLTTNSFEPLCIILFKPHIISMRVP